MIGRILKGIFRGEEYTIDCVEHREGLVLRPNDHPSINKMADSAKRSIGRYTLTYAYNHRGIPVLLVNGKERPAVDTLFANTTPKHALQLLRKRGCAFSVLLEQAINRGEI